MGSGGTKVVYELRQKEGSNLEDFVIGVLEDGQGVGTLTNELETLNKLKELGFPVVGARGPISIRINPNETRQGVLYERFDLGSKDVVRTVKKRVVSQGDTVYLNKRSISDLMMIRELLFKKKISVDDLQFLISKDGRVVIADPIRVKYDPKPSRVNLATIDMLLRKARENVASGGR